MRIMGVDGALASTGICVLESKKVLELTKIRTASVKATPNESARLKQISNEFTNLLKYHNPDCVVMENQHVSRLNAKTGLGLSRVRGVFQLICALHGVPFYTLEPSEIKKMVTNKGNANKELVQICARELYFDQPIVQTKLKEIITDGKNKTDDMADALAIAHTFYVKPEIAVAT